MQGATDFGLDVANLPCYYGLGAGAWQHWSRVWDVPYNYFVGRFDEVPSKGGRDARTAEENMAIPGITSTRWFDAVTMDSEEVDQKDNIKAMLVFGHGGNTVPRMQDARRGMDALDLLVVADPHPTTFAALHSRTDNTYLLPVCTQFECSGSRTASNRSVQWGEKLSSRFSNPTMIMQSCMACHSGLALPMRCLRTLNWSRASSAWNRHPNPSCAKSTVVAGLLVTPAKAQSG